MKKLHSLLWVFFFLWNVFHFCMADARTACSAQYGCFPNMTIIRGRRATLLARRSPFETKFYLFTRSNRETAELLNMHDPSSFAKSLFDPTCKTVMIVHGFTHHSYQPWVTKMKNELLKRNSLNVINVDWKKGASFYAMYYVKAVANTPLVGAKIAYLVQILNRVTGVNPQSIHIIGHSLGAHIAGYAGKRLARRNLLLGRITGLDPAKPNFEGANVGARLDNTDAKFVDVIHTNAAPFLLGGSGYRARLGHIDFYPNGGEYQPGCENLFSSIWRRGFSNAVNCNHMRAVEYFTISIGQKCPFTAFPCSSWEAFSEGRCFSKYLIANFSVMGYDVDTFNAYSKETMYLKIMPAFPFCVYNYVVAISFSKSRSNYNSLYVQLIGTKDESNKQKLRLSKGSGNKVKLITIHHNIGLLTSVKLFYYGFNSFYIQKVQVNILPESEIYTACFDQLMTNSFWSFWTLSEAKYERKAYVGEYCDFQFRRI